jgi:O-antigen ligase
MITAALTGLSAATPSTWPILAAAIGLSAATLIGVLFGWEGILVAMLACSLLPLPTLPVGSARFGVANLFPVAVLTVASYRARRASRQLTWFFWKRNLLLLLVAIGSLALSWIAWDPHVGVGATLGQGHRWIGYQLAGTFFLLLPFLTFSAGAAYSHVGSPGRALTAIVLVLPIAILLSLLQVDPAAYTFDPSGAAIHRLGIDYVDSVLLGVILFSAVLWATTRVVRIIALCGFIGCCLLIGVTFFLNAWVAMLAASTALVIHKARLRGLGAWLLGAGLVLLVSGSGLAELLSIRLSGNDSDRLRLWTDALRIFTLRPVLGVGPGNLTSYVEAFSSFSLAAVIGGYHQVHNFFLEILDEEGIIGLCLFLSFLAGVVAILARRGRGARSRAEWPAAAGLGLLVAGAGMAFFAAGLVPTVSAAGWGSVGPVVVIWFVAGLGVAARAGGAATLSSEVVGKTRPVG